MWLVTTLVAAAAATVAWGLSSSGFRRSWRLSTLALMLWGATVMIFIDHILGYGGGEFLEFTTEGSINSGALLGAVMLVPVFAVWGALVLIARFRSSGHRTL
ncbi:MAG: hypothetical protein QXG10_03820 [Candidatus Hadarchaeales archaeon]